ALDREGGDVLATAENEVLAAAGDPEVTGLVEVAQVAGVQPSVGVDGAGSVPEIPEHLGGRADQHLAVAVRRPLGEGDLHGGERHPADTRPVAGIAATGRGGLAAVLGQSVPGGDPRLDGRQL